jgi:hypothetical protein
MHLQMKIKISFALVLTIYKKVFLQKKNMFYQKGLGREESERRRKEKRGEKKNNTALKTPTILNISTELLYDRFDTLYYDNIINSTEAIKKAYNANLNYTIECWINSTGLPEKVLFDLISGSKKTQSNIFWFAFGSMCLANKLGTFISLFYPDFNTALLLTHDLRKLCPDLLDRMKEGLRHLDTR